MSPQPFGCLCGARWGGQNTAHCSACHITMTGITAFDKHRSGSHTSKAGRFCLSPEDAGLVLSSRVYPCWGLPGTTDFWKDEEE